VELRDLTLDDRRLYEGLLYDPVVMADLGGPLPPGDVEIKLQRDVVTTANDETWISVIVSDDGEAMGSVCIWSVEGDGSGGRPYSEIGWMVLPEFQGRGIGRWAVGAILDRARADGRWGVIHAHPGVSNAPSNGICRSLGFTMVETVDVDYVGRKLTCNHWQIDAGHAGVT